MTDRTGRPSEETIRAAIAEAGSIKAAATRLGVSRQTLHRWMRDLAINTERRTLAA